MVDPPASPRHCELLNIGGSGILYWLACWCRWAAGGKQPKCLPTHNQPLALLCVWFVFGLSCSSTTHPPFPPSTHQILGFPVQLVGLLTLPYLGVRWFVDGKSAGKDVEDAVVSIALQKQQGLAGCQA